MESTRVRQFESQDSCLLFMGRPRLLVMLLLGLLLAPAISATEGRAAPQCLELELSNAITLSSNGGLNVEPGACVIIDIGINLTNRINNLLGTKKRRKIVRFGNS